MSTRKVKAITEQLCGYGLSASSISAINKRLDESLKKWPSAMKCYRSYDKRSARLR
nr:transposase [Rhizobium mongolense]